MMTTKKYNKYLSIVHRHWKIISIISYNSGSQNDKQKLGDKKRKLGDWLKKKLLVSKLRKKPRGKEKSMPVSQSKNRAIRRLK